MLKVFYRLEILNAEGEWVGPFQGENRALRHVFLVDDAQDEYGYNTHYVPPGRAYDGENSESIVTGTPGPEGIIHWFPNVTDFLKEDDARIMRYLTNDVRYETDEQATFIPRMGQDVTEAFRAIL